MDFFGRQDRARRQTWHLVVWFCLAVAAIIVAVNVVLFLLWRWSQGADEGTWYWHPWTVQAIVATLAVIGFGSLLEYLQLRDGGPAIARWLGARPLDFATQDLRERQLLNVAEEMAIASGVPVPSVFVMDREVGLNAFVAGLTPAETALVLTQGALEQFNRDELQAVVGHEFSHILNGDMRLNVRLIAILAGILALGELGSFLFRLGLDSRSSDRRRGGVVLPLLAVGAALYLIGYIGLFCGRLIKAAISRQREFLADASSVQFTRHPAGLAEALLKIRNATTQSHLLSRHAEMMSHMCFGETLRFSGLFATHPPLEARIRAIDPTWLARDRARRWTKPEREAPAGTKAPEALSTTIAATPVLAAIPYALEPGPATAPVKEPATVQSNLDGAALLALIGHPGAAEVQQARALHARLPGRVREALRTTEGTRALIVALFLAEPELDEVALMAWLRAEMPGQLEQVVPLRVALAPLDRAFFLPLVDLAIPRLRMLPAPDLQVLLRQWHGVARMDRHFSVFEFAALALLQHALLGHGRKVAPLGLAQAVAEVTVVIRILLAHGHCVAPELWCRELVGRLVPGARPVPVREDLAAFQRALLRLRGLALAERRQLLEVAVSAVRADGRLSRDEAELLRLIGQVLDCPIPAINGLTGA